MFIDETGASTKMARLYGRAPRGQRLRAGVPHGHWKTTTFVGALRRAGMTAPMVLDGPMTGAWFLAYVEQVLARPGRYPLPSQTARKNALPFLCRFKVLRVARRVQLRKDAHA